MKSHKNILIWNFIFSLFVAFSCSAPMKPAKNPILPDFHADPSAHVFGDELWIFPSHDITGTKDYWNMEDWHAFSTTDMVNFKDHGVIFSLKDTDWAKRYAWAPDAIEKNGTNYFYFCASDEDGDQKGIANTIGVAVADKPQGPYKDALGKPLITAEEAGVPAMDPSIFIDDDKQAYLLFGAGHGYDGKVAIAEMNDDMISFKGKPKKVDLLNVAEGLWVHKYNDTYYFSYPHSIIKPDGEHVQELVYSTSKNIYGPYTFQGTILETDGRNVHQSIVEYKDQWFLFYHIVGPIPYERQVCVEV